MSLSVEWDRGWEVVKAVLIPVNALVAMPLHGPVENLGGVLQDIAISDPALLQHSVTHCVPDTLPPPSFVLKTRAVHTLLQSLKNIKGSEQGGS